jgi:hypothetical protein
MRLSIPAEANGHPTDIGWWASGSGSV